MSPCAPLTRGLCILCILCCCIISLALGQSYNYGFDVTRAYNTKRQLGENLIITTGMPVGSGPVPVRPNIRDLQKDPDKWALYILALDMMQWTDQSQPTSWFSITGMLHCAVFLPRPVDNPNLLSDSDAKWFETGIHGVPFEPWNGVYPTPGNEMAGYCHHTDILFPTWHRAYVALYEVSNGIPFG